MGGVGADWAGTGGLYLAGAGRKDTFVPTGAFCFLAHQYRRSGIPDEKEHLEAMLNSVSRQSYPHWELIVADAGGTAESVQAWAKRTESVCGKRQMHQILQNGRIRASCSAPFPKTKEFPPIRTQELNLRRETRSVCWITTIC